MGWSRGQLGGTQGENCGFPTIADCTSLPKSHSNQECHCPTRTQRLPSARQTHRTEKNNAGSIVQKQAAECTGQPRPIAGRPARLFRELNLRSSSYRWKRASGHNGGPGGDICVGSNLNSTHFQTDEDLDCWQQTALFML